MKMQKYMFQFERTIEIYFLQNKEQRRGKDRYLKDKPIYTVYTSIFERAFYDIITQFRSSVTINPSIKCLYLIIIFCIFLSMLNQEQISLKTQPSVDSPDSTPTQPCPQMQSTQNQSCFGGMYDARKIKTTIETLIREKVDAESSNNLQGVNQDIGQTQIPTTTGKGHFKIYVVLTQDQSSGVMDDFRAKYQEKFTTISLEDSFEVLVSSISNRKQLQIPNQKKNQTTSQIPLVQQQKEIERIGEQVKVEGDLINDQSKTQEIKETQKSKEETPQIHEGEENKLQVSYESSQSKFEKNVENSEQSSLTEEKSYVPQPSDTSLVNQKSASLSDQLDKAFVEVNQDAVEEHVLRYDGKYQNEEESFVKYADEEMAYRSRTPQNYKPKVEEKSSSYETSFDINTSRKQSSYRQFYKQGNIEEAQGTAKKDSSEFLQSSQILEQKQNRRFNQNNRKVSNLEGSNSSEFQNRKTCKKFEAFKIPEEKIVIPRENKTEWQKYLECLSYAQTELTYLCQQMDWAVKFYERTAQIGVEMFSCKVEVSIIINSVFRKYSGSCEAAKGKRDARHYAAIHCLADLYTSIDGLWQKFKKLKQENEALYQPCKANNTDILDMWFQNKKIEEDKMWKLEDELYLNENIDVDKYVEGLKSCKKEMYYFVAQNNKIFMTPKWIIKRPNILGYWEAEGYVRYELKEKIYQYRYKNKGRSKKESEERVSHVILKQMYRDFPGMFKRFRKIKQERGFI